MPALVKLQDEYADLPLIVIAVTTSDKQTARLFSVDYKLNYAILANAEADHEAYGVDLVWGSTIYLIDPEGKIVARGLEDIGVLLEEERKKKGE